MKKIYATLILSSLIFSVNAQQGGRKAVAKHADLSAASLSKYGNNNNATVVCDTVTTIAPTDSLFLYTSGNGYVAGNNGYGDEKKATFITPALIPAGATITGVFTIFYKNTNGQGTKGSGAISVDILAGDTTTGPTGVSLGTSATTLTTLLSSGVQVNNDYVYMFSFGSAVVAPAAGFFVSLNLPSTTGDTAALFLSQTSSVTNHNYNNYAWEFADLGGGAGYNWYSMRANWNLPCALTMLPVLCYNSTGIHNNILEASVAFFPNPSNGQFNFVLSLPEATNLNVSVVNTLGQTVFTKTENGFKGGLLNYDLTSLGKGVYFANITDSNNNKVVKKLIIE